MKKLFLIKKILLIYLFFLITLFLICKSTWFILVYSIYSSYFYVTDWNIKCILSKSILSKNKVLEITCNFINIYLLIQKLFTYLFLINLIKLNLLWSMVDF